MSLSLSALIMAHFKMDTSITVVVFTENEIKSISIYRAI